MSNKISDIENYIDQLEQAERDFLNSDFTNQSSTFRSVNILDRFIFIVRCLIDFCLLHLSLCFKKYKSKKIVYTAYNFCNIVNGSLEDRILKPLFTEDILFINQSKEIYISRINNSKVFNLGGLSVILSSFFIHDTSKMKYLRAYKYINNTIFKRFSKKDIYLLWFYDLNSLSIVFSKYRQRLHLIEVQHGSIINYPPYTKPAPVKAIDTFYVKNQQTIDYLRSHFCKNIDCNYHLIPYPKNNKVFTDGTHILYASTVDFSGLHPVFIKFLENNKVNDLHIQIRLHPRERTIEKKEMFAKEMTKFQVDFSFDETENWLESNKIENLIVVSPWSSTIEDAVDNGYKTVILDTIGKERFKYLIDDKNCFYSDSLEETVSLIANSY